MRNRYNQNDIVGVLLVLEDRQFAFLYINLKRELTFLIIVLAVLSRHKFWSKSVPKYVILLCDFIR